MENPTIGEEFYKPILSSVLICFLQLSILVMEENTRSDDYLQGVCNLVTELENHTSSLALFFLSYSDLKSNLYKMRSVLFSLVQ